jgi:sporulation protein YlmC with PRC-barrel domain
MNKDTREFDYIGQSHPAEPEHAREIVRDAHTSTLTHSRVMPVSMFMGYRVINPVGEDLGKIEDIVVDMDSRQIAYAVLSFGGFLGFGNKLFAIPWEALKLSSKEDEFILHVNREALENAPGFDKDYWPEMADRQWAAGIYDYYGYQPYWKE